MDSRERDGSRGGPGRGPTTVPTKGKEPTPGVLFDVVKAWADNQTEHPQGAEGTANGIGFTYAGPNWWRGVTTDGSFTGFGNANHVPPLARSDRIHIAGSGHFHFDKKISRIEMHVAQHKESQEEFHVVFRTKEDPGHGEITPATRDGDIKTDRNSFWTTSVEGGVVRYEGLYTEDLWFSPVDGDGNCVDIALIPMT